jgi:AcrR family transcriptional regulator
MSLALMSSRIKPDSRFSRKRALIIKAAAHTFGRKGFHATTLEEIAAHLKVTKASLYYYFSTKEELLYEVHLLSMQDLLHRVEKVLEKESSPVTKLQAMVTEHLKILAGDYEGAILLQQEYELPPKYREEIIRLRDRYEQQMLGVIREGVLERVFRVKDPRIMVRMLLGSVNWFLRWYRADGRLSVDEIADAYMDAIFYGLLAPTLPVSAVEASGTAERRSTSKRARARRPGAHAR